MEQRYIEETNIARAVATRPYFSAVATDDEYEGEDEPGAGRPPLVRRLRAILDSALAAPRLAVGSAASYSYGLRDFGEGVLHTVLNNHHMQAMTTQYLAQWQFQGDEDARPASPMVLVDGDNSSFPRSGRTRAIQQTRVILHSAVGAPHVVEGTHAVTVPGIPEVGIPAQHTVLNPNMLPALEDDHIQDMRMDARQPQRPYFSAVFSDDDTDDEDPDDDGPGYCRYTNVNSLRFVLETADGAPHVIAGLQVPDINGDGPGGGGTLATPTQRLLSAPRVQGGHGTLPRHASGSAGECFRQGGAKRAYPFGPFQLVSEGNLDEGTAASSTGQGGSASGHPEVADDSAASRKASRAAPRSAVVLVYHGTFAPLHIGHVECLGRAIAHLKKNQVDVTKAVVGFTTANQVGDKAPGTGLAEVQVRANIARDVLSLANFSGVAVEVDGHEYAKASELAAAHHSPMAVSLYLVGSDVTKKPSRETLIVTRTKAEAARYSTGEFYDHAEAKGVCFQTKAFGVSSTWVRQVLMDKRMPLFYSTNAQDLICAALRLKRRTVAANTPSAAQCENDASDGGLQASDATGSQQAAPAVVATPNVDMGQPKSKAMPKRTMVETANVPRRSYGPAVLLRPVSGGVGSADVGAQREPLPRRRSQVVQLPDRPPLPRRRLTDRAQDTQGGPIAIADDLTDSHADAPPHGA
eukprot:4172049-Amphidinium_carterae.1